MEKNYIVSARKYRPSTFRSVVGQDSLTGTLKNAINSGRLAQAYLFCGPRGVGKTSCARIFAKTINCQNRTAEGEACGECDSCLDFQRGQSYNVVELDAASNNGVDHMRSLTEQVYIPPQMGNYRVFIIDEVHMLSSQAFNAFLKTLEEPPSYAIFILATTEKNKVIPTILSRCQIFDFNRITNDDISKHLAYVASQENISAEPMALDVIAQKADGAMRDALSIFDQVSAATSNNITYQATLDNLNVLDYEYYFRFCKAFKESDVAEAMLLYKEIRDKGFDSRFFVNGLATHIRNLLVAADKRTLPLLEVGTHIAERYHTEAIQFEPKWYYAALKILSDCDLDYRVATDKQLLVELALIRLCQLSGGSPDGGNDGKKEPIKNVATTASQAPVNNAPAANKTATTAASPAAPVHHVAPRQPVNTRKPVKAPPVMPSLRGNNNVPAEKKSAEPAAADDDKSGRSVSPITEESLAQAWQEYISENSDRHILVNVMRLRLPERVSDSKYVIKVDNPIQQQEMLNESVRLQTFLRERLKNDNLLLDIEMLAAETHIRQTPIEMLKNMVEENKDLADLLKFVDAEMA